MKQQTILVVEDDHIVSDYICANCEKRDYRVILAVDGEEAIKYLQLLKPDLILLDTNMPHIDGYEVCRAVRKWSEIPIIMLSDRASSEDEVKCLCLGANSYMSKPFSMEILFSRIKALLRRAQLNQYNGVLDNRCINDKLLSTVN